MWLFFRSALAGREPLRRVLIYLAVFSFVGGFIGSFFNETERSIRLPVLAIAAVCIVVCLVMLWRCADNSALKVGWFIRSSIVFGAVGMLLIWSLP